MRPQFSAAREAMKKGGVIDIAASVPVAASEQEETDRHERAETIRIRACPVEVSTELEVLAEMRVRQRRWMSLKTAIAKVDDRRLRHVLQIFRGQYRCSTGMPRRHNR